MHEQMTSMVQIRYRFFLHLLLPYASMWICRCFALYTYTYSHAVNRRRQMIGNIEMFVVLILLGFAFEITVTVLDLNAPGGSKFQFSIASFSSSL